MKQHADSKRSEQTFEVEDLEFMKLQPYHQTSVALRKNLKLASKYFGPYPVIKKIRPMAYELQLPTESLIHPIFHVSQLKKLGPKEISAKEPPFRTLEGQIIAEIVALLDWRMVKIGNRIVTQL